MKIDRIQIDGFGRLLDFDTGPDALGRLVVVAGPNEAGKSTLFSFLTTSLYGFSPANRDSNPHVPWGAEEAGGRIHVRTDEGDCAVVERRLRSAPAGRLQRGDVTLDLRNQPVEMVSHVPRAVFRQVFAITLSELAGLDDETWARIQDRVLGSMGAADLGSAREIADDLEREAGEIWRPNRRGNQRLRDLREEMRALRSRRGDAIRRDREIRSRMEERDTIEAALKDIRHQLERDRAVVDRIQELLPLKRQLDRIEALRAEAGPREGLRRLPADLGPTLERLEEERDRLRREQTEIDDATVAPRSAVERFGPGHEAVLSARDRISGFLRGSADGRLGATVVEHEERVAACTHRLEAAAAPLFGTLPDDAVLARLESLSIDLLGDRLERLAEATRTREAARPTGGRTGTIGPAALLAGGAGLTVWGLTIGSGPLAGVGAAAAALGGLLLRASGRSAAPDTGDRADALHAEVRSMLSGLPLTGEHLDPPAPHLAAGLERVRDLAGELRAAEAALRDARSRLDARAEAAAALAATLGREAPSDLPTFEAEVERALEEARSAQDAAEQARRELARLERSSARVRGALQTAEERTDALLSLVEAVVGGRTDQHVREACARIEQHEHADRIEEELERSVPDLADRRSRIRELDRTDDAWSVSEAELAERRARIREAEAEVEERSGRVREIGRDIEHLREAETVDAVDSSLEAMRATEARLIEDRDRAWVLARLIREADRRFREEHQPDLLRRASGYLQRLTDGRYERLIVDERTGSDLFQLTGPTLPRPVPLDRPISTGTLEQAYLALRLAIVDHLDAERERLPLFIDEAFVNWDANRRDRGLNVLAEVSAERQVFAFTCHPEMAAGLERLGARVVSLSR